jgi:hypothetical protein
VSWGLQFSEPIVLSDGSKLATLQDAYDHLNKCPKSEQDAEDWRAAVYCLIEAAKHGGAVAFARIAMLRAIKQQADRASALELIDLTMREVQQLKNDPVDPVPADEEASLSVPAVMNVIVEIVSSPAVPVKLDEPTSIQREREPTASIKPPDDLSLIAPENLQSAITKAVKNAEPAFVGVIVQRTTPKSRFDANWAIRGVKFGKADREKANKAVTSVVERMKGHFRLSDGRERSK